MGLWILLFTLARATPPLVYVTDTADQGLRAWWRPGDLLVAGATGSAGLRPLQAEPTAVVPADLSGWKALGARCASSAQARVALPGGEAEVKVAGTEMAPLLRIERGGQTLAESPLGRPARVCELLVANLDATEGLELAVAWQMGDPKAPISGISLFRVPDVAR
jgi:hypothetical protein